LRGVGVCVGCYWLTLYGSPRRPALGYRRQVDAKFDWVLEGEDSHLRTRQFQLGQADREVRASPFATEPPVWPLGEGSTVRIDAQVGTH